MPFYCQSCNTTISTTVDVCPECNARAPEGGFQSDSRLGELVAGDQFRVLRRIGSGGFGVVYEVETIVGGLRRALKVLHRHLAEDAEIQKRFINEALVLEQVNHPNVARCYAAGRLSDGALYLLFELIDGAPLSSIIADTGPIEPMRAVRIAKHIAAGLKAAHESGVLHRDLKPENILVTNVGSHREHAKVVDFGIAKLTDQGMTSTQNVVGTPHYMPPEQFLPGSPLDYRVDLWQLGATLFAMLCGRPPYAGVRGGVAAIIAEQQRRTDLGPAPSEVDDSLKKQHALNLLVSQLLATDPDRRPASAAAVTRELARIENGLSPNARGGSEALLGALCATPSDSAWIALHGYLGSQADKRPQMAETADRMLEGWPDEVRRAPNALWDASSDRPHALWPIVRTLDLSARGLGDDDVRQLAANPALANITRLDLSHNEIGNEGLSALACSPYLSNLVHLDLESNRLTSAGVVALAESTTAPSLRALRLGHNGIGARGADALANSSLRLQHLDVSGNELGPEGAEKIGDSVTLVGLRFLGMAETGIGPDGVASLAVSRYLTRLETLDLCHNNVGAGGAATLALSENMRSLRALRLSQNGLGRQGLQLLLGSSTFIALEELDISGNGLGASGAMLLAGSPFARRLERLTLSDDELGDAGIAAILGSSHLTGLRCLGLAQNDMSAAGAKLLVDASPQLESLDLSHNPIGNHGAPAIAEALAQLRITDLRVAGCDLGADGIAQILDTRRLKTLDIDRNPMGPEGARAIASSAGASALHELSMAHVELGPEGLGAFAGATILAELRSLDLSSNSLGDEGATLLVANASRLPRLTDLVLEDNGLGPDAAQALAVSPLANHLQRLQLASNQLGDDGAEELARGPSWHALRVIDVQRNGISLAGAAAMSSAERMGMVQRMNLSHNALGAVVDIHSIAHDKLGLMEASFTDLREMGADFAEGFYALLFARYPGVKPLFAKTSMRKQYGHLMSTLTLVIDNLRKPDTLDAAVRELGHRHVGYKVSPSHYFAVTSTLVDAMGAALGDRWNTELEEAWAEGLEAIANVMMDAGRKAAVEADTKAMRRPSDPAETGVI